jgi:alpha-glucoside transport system permease protein
VDRYVLLVIAVAGVPAVLVAYIVGSEFLVQRFPERLQGKVRPWFWVGPTLALVGMFLVYPAIKSIYISLTDNATGAFIGLANYATVLGDTGVRVAIRNNALWLVIFTGLVLAFGLLFAVLTDRVSYEGPAKSLIFMPMAISFVAAGVIWKFMFLYQPPGTPQTGTLNAFVTFLHLDPKAWLLDRSINNLALITVGTWIWTGFGMVILSAALKQVPAELLEAARVDGANEFTIFFRVILPLLAPTITVVGTTMVITALKTFDLVYVMTNGNYDTEVIANRMYKELFNVRNLSTASAIAVILLLTVIPVLYFNLQRFRTQEAQR